MRLAQSNLEKKIIFEFFFFNLKIFKRKKLSPKMKPQSLPPIFFLKITPLGPPGFQAILMFASITPDSHKCEVKIARFSIRLDRYKNERIKLFLLKTQLLTKSKGPRFSPSKWDRPFENDVLFLIGSEAEKT